jgi:hypothetical protein
MTRIADDITGLIGGTPLVRLSIPEHLALRG